MKVCLAERNSTSIGAWQSVYCLPKVENFHFFGKDSPRRANPLTNFYKRYYVRGFYASAIWSEYNHGIYRPHLLNFRTEGLHEWTEYVPHLRNWKKSLTKPLKRQNISNCSVFPPEIVMHDAFNVILWTSADICVVVHDDLGWKNRTTRCNRFWRAGCSRLEYVDIRLVY